MELEQFLLKFPNGKDKSEYIGLVKNAKQCNNYEYSSKFERHHIVPKSLGGDNSSSNVVYLSAYDHILAHYYLARFTGEPKMLSAFSLIVGEPRYRKLSEVQKCSLDFLPEWAELREKALHTGRGPECSHKISEKAKARWKRFKESGEIEKVRKNISEATKKGMSKPQVLQKVRVNLGSKWYYSKQLDRTMHWYPGDPEPDKSLWVLGRKPMSKESRQKLSSSQRKLQRVFYHNDALQINKRFGPQDEIPEGFVLGKKAEYCGNRRKYELNVRKVNYEKLGCPDRLVEDYRKIKNEKSQNS